MVYRVYLGEALEKRESAFSRSIILNNIIESIDNIRGVKYKLFHLSVSLNVSYDIFGCFKLFISCFKLILGDFEMILSLIDQKKRYLPMILNTLHGIFDHF